MISDQELLSQVQVIHRSLDSLRYAIATLSRKNLELLQLLAELQRKQEQKSIPKMKGLQFLRALSMKLK